ncbi:MAG: beta-phosphoglucomutase [Deltaproteobacteria bacterium]|nr:MAG: beta-phosphoglucomutase [Deltaproteobacteria bacterium]
MIKLIVFDCDGVMFDSKPVNQRYYNQILDHFGKPAMTADELEYVHMHNVQEGVSHIFRNYQEIDMEEVNNYRNGMDYTRFIPYMVIGKDLKEFLEAVKERFYLAISTNRSDTMELLLDTFGIKQYFGKVMTPINAERPKPAPDAMLEILDYYQVKAEETIFIGDSMVDQMHAKASGVQLIAFNNQSLQTPYHVKSFMEIWKLPIMMDS